MKTLTILLVSILTVLVCAQVFAVTPDFSTAVAAWSMGDGTAGNVVAVGELRDSNGPDYSNNTVGMWADGNTNPTWANVGVGNGMAVEFDGSADVVYFDNGANDEINATSGPFTIWTRTKITGLSADGSHAVLGRSANNYAPDAIAAYELMLKDHYVYGADYTFAQFEFFGVDGYTEVLGGTPTRTANNVWLEIAVTYDPTNLVDGLKLYQREEGEATFTLVDSAGAVGVARSTDNTCWTAIGGQNGSGRYDKHSMNGMVEGAALWGAVYSQEDLNALSGSPVVIPEPSLLLVCLAAMFIRNRK